VEAANVSGHITTNTVWSTAQSPYNVVGTLYVDAGIVLTIGSGVEVYNGSHAFYVDGVVNATGALFTGSTYLYARSGGLLNLSGCTVAGSLVQYATGSGGTLSGNIFNTARLELWSTSASVNGNTFHRADPVSTSPSLVPELVDNTFDAPSGATIGISGTLGADATWPVIGQASRYSIDGTVTVPAGRTLTLASGVGVYSHGYSFYVDGVVDGTGAVFTGSTYLYARSGGLLNLSGCTVAGSLVQYASGSGGTLRGNIFTTARLEVWSSSVTVQGQ
jgi:hypothetical protein